LTYFFEMRPFSWSTAGPLFFFLFQNDDSHKNDLTGRLKRYKNCAVDLALKGCGDIEEAEKETGWARAPSVTAVLHQCQRTAYNP